MKFFIVLSTLVAVSLAKPTQLLTPVVYTALAPGAPLGLDGRVVDTAEVAFAKAEHATAHLNERLNLAKEAVRSADVIVAHAAPVAQITAYPAVQHVYTASHVLPVRSSTIIGADGHVQDTAEVLNAKTAHAAAHAQERINLANEALRSANYVVTNSQNLW